ncbi:hypothetical protein E2986_01581 [Frieseomelitta varia]|uniref:Ig-like domain-containing protein n=1 Tax=Frieseomelitta varia TaxID=561572 RepID=A0A833S169_9HYME|nr:hypothetical protein E2986_01581 [Frieseomelitta varia]
MFYHMRYQTAAFRQDSSVQSGEISSRIDRPTASRRNVQYDLTCRTIFQDSATPMVAWIKADTKAVLAIHEHVITNNARLSVTHSDYNTWTLNIRAVRREDRGIYMCQVNTDPMKSQSAFLEVVIPPDIISEETSNDLMVPEGGSAKLVCKARGYPKPEIVWKREDGAEIISRAGLSGGKTKIISAALGILFTINGEYSLLFFDFVEWIIMN